MHRQGALSVHQFELLPKPPDTRTADNPWPLWPNVFRVSTAHEEGGERVFSVSTQRFSGDAQGRVKKLHGSKVELVRKDGRMSFEPVPGSEFEMDVDLVLLAMGFLGPERQGLLDNFGVKLTERGNVWRDGNWMTSVPGVFAAGDMQRGQSLIVWAIAEGRSAARGVDLFLMGESDLPAPLRVDALRRDAQNAVSRPASSNRSGAGSEHLDPFLIRNLTENRGRHVDFFQVQCVENADDALACFRHVAAAPKRDLEGLAIGLCHHRNLAPFEKAARHHVRVRSTRSRSGRTAAV